MLTGRKLGLTLVFAGLLLVAFGAGCRGFFVQPTLSSIAVGPATPTIETGSTDNTVQMTVFGTYNDGSTGTPAVEWSINPTSVATISSGGLVTSVATGTATVTATSVQNPSITGTQSLTVTVGCIQSIKLSTTTPISLSLGTSGQDSVQLSATATTCNGTVDITNTATWTSSNTSIVTVNGGLVTGVAQGSATVTASSGSVVSPATTVNVGP